jgi:hypothetical protein
MVEAMSWPTGFLEDLRDFKKTWNEEDVFLLHTLRVVLALAGLLRKFKGSFRVTRKGERLAQESAAGKLYTALFRAFFRKFNLGYLDRFPECFGVQETLAYSLFMVGRHATDWVSPQQLAPRLLLPTVSAEIPLSPFGTDDRVLLSEIRILRPLVRFGLIECQAPEERAPFRLRLGRVRKTVLFDAFLSFDLGGD